MRRIMLCTACFLFAAVAVNAQKYFTRDGKIAFYSDAQIEKIEAHNKTATSVLDTESGKMEFAVLIKAFQFEKALMQEHFNENYMESSKFPKATFKGSLTNAAAVNFNKEGTYEATVKGAMTIHGVTKEIETQGKIVVTKETIQILSNFEIVVADYEIEIPALVKDNIAKNVRVELDATHIPLKKGS